MSITTDFVLRDDPETERYIGRRVFDGNFELPRLVIKETAMLANIDVMNRYCEQSGVSIAPHAKTTMAPVVIEAQLRSGVWGITVATVQQLKVCLRLGAKTVILANEVVNKPAAGWIAAALIGDPDCTIYSLVDSVASVQILAQGLRDAGLTRPYPVLLEIGVAGYRTGCRSPGQVMAVAEAIAAEPNLVLAGVEGYEGVIGTDRSPEEISRVDDYLRGVVDYALLLQTSGAFGSTEEVLLSAGGSHYFDRVVEIFSTATLLSPHRVVLRSGCYVTADHRTYTGPPPAGRAGEPIFSPALELWSEVLSTPEPGLAIAGFGKRDASYDKTLPIVLGRCAVGSAEIERVVGIVVTKLHDQHAFLDTQDGPSLSVGDRLICGLVHPCTAFDRWHEIALVDDRYRLRAVVETFF